MIPLQILFLTLAVFSAAEIFSSMKQIDLLYDNSEYILDEIETFVDEEIARLRELAIQAKKFRQDLIGHAISMRLPNPATHPTTAFTLISRFSRLIDSIYSNETIARFESNIKGIAIPSGIDHQGAIRSLVGLKNMYGLTNHEIATGNIRGYQGLVIPREDLVELDALLRNEAPIWAKRYEEYRLTDIRDNLDILESITKENQQNDKEMKMEELKYILSGESTFLPQYEMDYRMVNYGKLCRGEVPKSNENLVCQFARGSVPYERIQEEIVSNNPYIALFHNVISDAEVSTLKMMTDSMFRSKVGSLPSIIPGRLSQQQWISDVDPIPERSRLATTLSNRVQRFTALSTAYRPIDASAESLQVLNYGLGGEYGLHVDFERETDFKNEGPRVATFMFYLSEPIAGGATVFPDAGVSVPPVKGAAAFWYNLFADGSGDERTHHAGCPVLLGHKWIANKWIRQAGQERRRPCPLQPDHLPAYDPVSHMKSFVYAGSEGI